MVANGSEFVTLSQLKEFSQSLSSGGGAIDSVYPIGSIYMSVNSTDPSTLFGGTWSRIQGRFLLAAGGGYSAGSTGGESSHKLTIDEMPVHSHTVALVENPLNSGPFIAERGRYAKSSTMTTGSNGGGESHNNMPPYLAVYMWKRTA